MADFVVGVGKFFDETFWKDRCLHTFFVLPLGSKYRIIVLDIKTLVVIYIIS